MKVVIKKPGQSPYVEDIKTDLKTQQNIVGGHIETLHITDDIIMICNEDGKLQGLPYNFYLSQYNDKIVGTVFFVGDDVPEFRGLTDEEVEIIMGWF